MYLCSLSLYGLSLLLLPWKSKENAGMCSWLKKKSDHMSDHDNGSSTYLRNTTTTTIAATTRRNAAPPITDPTSRGSRFWICCECSSVGENVRIPWAVDVSLRQRFCHLRFRELENYKHCCYCNSVYFCMCLFFNEYTLKPAILFSLTVESGLNITLNYRIAHSF